jgi:hypothetical protein
MTRRDILWLIGAAATANPISAFAGMTFSAGQPIPDSLEPNTGELERELKDKRPRVRPQISRSASRRRKQQNKLSTADRLLGVPTIDPPKPVRIPTTPK